MNIDQKRAEYIAKRRLYWAVLIATFLLAAGICAVAVVLFKGELISMLAGIAIAGAATAGFGCFALGFCTVRLIPASRKATLYCDKGIVSQCRLTVNETGSITERGGLEFVTLIAQNGHLYILLGEPLPPLDVPVDFTLLGSTVLGYSLTNQ